MTHATHPLSLKYFVPPFCLPAGLVPITVGARTIDPVTGEPGPVIGVRTNPWTNTVVPIVQSLGALPRGAADPDLVIKKPRKLQLFYSFDNFRELLAGAFKLQETVLLASETQLDRP